jgi:site-specific recombinase XerD
MLTEVAQFVNWVYLRNTNARTWKDYSYDLKLFVQLIGDKPVDEITIRDIDHFIECQSERGAQSRTINRRVKTVSALFNFLATEQQTLVNPVLPKRHFLQEPKRLPRPVPHTDQELFFGVIKDARDKAMFTLMLRCGLRIGEVAGLKMDNLYLKEVKPRLQFFGKGSKERTVYLSAQALKLLKALLAQRPVVDDQHVFLSYQRKGLSATAIHLRLMRYRDLGGVRLTAHQFRHSFGCNLIQERVPIVTVQKLMGHSWVQTTMNYVEVNDPEVQDDFYTAADKLDGWTS